MATKTINGVPVFAIRFQEDDEISGVDFISLVDQPAIMTNWVAMNEKKSNKIKFNADKQLLYGPFMIPNMPIYRFDEEIGEYYVTFSEETIEKLVRKFQAQQKTLNINYQHQENSQVKSAVVQEVWLTGENDKSKDFGFSLPKGSAFAVTHIGDKAFWSKEVKSGNVRGYSIEGFLDLEMFKLKIKEKMSKDKFTTATTTEGVKLSTPAETWAEGVEVNIVGEDGAEETAPDKEYVLENGTTLVVEGGVVKSIVEADGGDGETPTPEEAAMEELMNIIRPALEKAIEGKFNEMKEELSEIKLSLQKANTKSKTSKTDTEEKPTQKEVFFTRVDQVRKFLNKKENE